MLVGRYAVARAADATYAAAVHRLKLRLMTTKRQEASAPNSIVPEYPRAESENSTHRKCTAISAAVHKAAPRGTNRTVARYTSGAVTDPITAAGSRNAH